MTQTSPKPPRPTPDQRRATAALEALKSATQFDEFAKTCKQTSARILTSGLLPALAFLDAKRGSWIDRGQLKFKDSVQHQVLASICAFLLTSDSPFASQEKVPPQKNDKRKDIEAPGDMTQEREMIYWFCSSATAVQLRRAQAEALAYLDWLARFADARKIMGKAEKGETE